MFKNVSVLMVICLLVIACNGYDKPKKPDNLISKDKMSEVLYDLYIINAAKGVNKKILETSGFIPETYVLTKYNLDSIQFAESNEYYSFDTDTYKAIIDEVKARLEKEKEEFEVVKKKEDEAKKLKQDSINKIRLRKKDSINKLNKDTIVKSKDTILKKKDTIVNRKKDSKTIILDSTAKN